MTMSVLTQFVEELAAGRHMCEKALLPAVFRPGNTLGPAKAV